MPLATTITDVKRHDLARLDMHGQPYPLFVCLLVDKAGHVVDFNFQTLDHDVGIGCEV